MFMAVLFLTAKTGNNPNVHKLETGERTMYWMESSVTAQKVAPHTPLGGNLREAYSHVRKEQRNEGGRKHVNLPKILGSHIFPPPVSQNLCTVSLLS